MFKTFPDGPPSVEILLFFLRMVQEGSGMTTEEIPVRPWSGVIPEGYLDIGDGTLTWESLYQRIPDGIPFLNYTVQWRTLFKIFPDGPPPIEDLLNFLRMAQAGSGEVPVRPWRGVIPEGYLDIGNGNVTWEDLYQRLPNGLPFRNYTISWKRLFTTFPDGPPTVQELVRLVMRRMTPGRAEDSEEMQSSWSGIVPQGLLNLGDGRLTWEELYQAMPAGLQIGNYTFPWKLLFMMFPNGPPPPEDWLELAQEVSVGHVASIDETLDQQNGGETTSAIAPWTGLIPQGLLNIGDGSITW